MPDTQTGYLGPDGRVIYVGAGLSGKAWGTYYRRPGPGQGTHRLKSPNLPVRETKTAAQFDLATYAARQKDWQRVEIAEADGQLTIIVR